MLIPESPSETASSDDGRTEVESTYYHWNPALRGSMPIKREDLKTSSNRLEAWLHGTVPHSSQDLKLVPAEKPFPFMKLPPELRQLVFKELLVQSQDIVIFEEYWETAYHARITSLAEMSHRVSHSPAATCQIFRASKACYNEAMPIYFSCNRFAFESLDLLLLLDKLKVDYRRNIKNLSINLWGHFPAKSIRILRACTALRRLHLHVSFRTLRYSKYGFFSVLKSNGINDLLKIRGITELDVTKSELSFFDTRMEGWEPFLEALQVLKQPYSTTALRCQYMKDYPPEKAQRVIFGKANVMTRSERRLIKNAGEEQEVVDEQQQS